jgi:hypothetical protein
MGEESAGDGAAVEFTIGRLAAKAPLRYQTDKSG